MAKYRNLEQGNPGTGFDVSGMPWNFLDATARVIAQTTGFPEHEQICLSGHVRCGYRDCNREIHEGLAVMSEKKIGAAVYFDEKCYKAHGGLRPKARGLLFDGVNLWVLNPHSELRRTIVEISYSS